MRRAIQTTDEGDEKQTADDRHFKLAVEVFLRRHLVAEDPGKLSLILRRIAGEQLVLVGIPFAWAVAIQNSGDPVASRVFRAAA